MIQGKNSRYGLLRKPCDSAQTARLNTASIFQLKSSLFFQVMIQGKNSRYGLLRKPCDSAQIARLNTASVFQLNSSL